MSYLKFILLFILFQVFLCCSCEKKTEPFVCTDKIGCVDITGDEPIRIGVLQALSGKVATLGKEQVRGIELALDARGGMVCGHPVYFQVEDTGCTSEGGANAVLKIIANPQNIAILGTTCSGAAATASKAMSGAGLTMVSGNNSAPFLTSIGDKKAPNWYKGYFRTAPNEENSGKAAAIFAYKKLGIRKAATINDCDIYTTGLTDGFNKAFSELGGKIVLDTSVSKGEKRMAPVLQAVLNAKAELLFFPLFHDEGSAILLQARKMKAFEQIVLMSDGALINSSFLSEVGEKGKGLYFVGPSTPTGPEIDLLEKKYIDKYKMNPSVFYYLKAFDAANILFSAIESIAVADEDGALHIGRENLRQAMFATRKHQGISGELDCDEFGDCGFPAFDVIQLENVEAGLAGLISNVKYKYQPQ